MFSYQLIHDQVALTACEFLSMDYSILHKVKLKRFSLDKKFAECCRSHVSCKSRKRATGDYFEIFILKKC